jgi:hypothetical protein
VPAKIDFIHPHPAWSDPLVLGLELGRILIEDIADGFLVDADLLGHGRKCVVERLATDPVDQPFRHLAFFVHLWDGGSKGLAARLAHQPWRIEVNHDLFAVGRQIAHVERQLAVANHLMGPAAVRAQSGNGNRLGLDVIFPFAFLEVQHM